MVNLSVTQSYDGRFFLHDLGEDFGIMKIRLGHISSIYGIPVCHSTCTGLKLEILEESKVCTTRI